MIDDKPHLIEKEVFDLRKYIVSALFLLKIIEIVITIYMVLTELSLWRNTDFDKKQQNPLSESVSTKTLLDSGLHFVVGAFVSLDRYSGHQRLQYGRGGVLIELQSFLNALYSSAAIDSCTLL